MTGFGAFDIECTEWDVFVCAALLTPEGDCTIYWSEVDAFRAVAEFEGTLWTWAGGRYDMVWLYSLAKMLGVRCEARMSGGQIVSLVIGNCTIRDGFKLYPVALAEASKIGDTPKLETGFACVCGQDCGGYCQITRTMNTADRARLSAYLVGDVKATAATVRALHEFADCHEIELKATVGASAWATLRKMGAPKAEWKRVADYKFARLGYYGGRTEVYRTRADVIYQYDINSAYPAALKAHAVPTGGYRRVRGKAARDALFSMPGVFAARVSVPAVHAPPLPNRGVGRLLFVTGEQTGHWTGVELAAAEAVGCRILDVTEAIVWEREERIAAPFMETFWGLRAHYGKKSPQGAWLKWFVNSLTGKLAMRPEGERLLGNPSPDEIKVCPAKAPCFGVLCGRGVGCCKHRCEGTCRRWEALDRHATIWSAPTFSLADCAHVQWAATLTAHTRIELGAQLRAAGDAAAYCDTDSVKATEPLTRRIGKELGEWNDEGKDVDWFAPFPKAYRSASAETGEYKTRAKGVPYLDAIRFDRWAAGTEGVALDRGVWGVKGGARRGQVFERRNLTRFVRADGRIVGSRVVLQDGGTRPLSWSEYRASLGKKGNEK